jgi:hypothetical protein
MKKVFFSLLAVIAVGLFIRVAYLVLSSPPEPALTAPDHDAAVAQLNHIFRQAAYTITWAIQLGYVAWLGLNWQKPATGSR